MDMTTDLPPTTFADLVEYADRDALAAGMIRIPAVTPAHNRVRVIDGPPIRALPVARRGLNRKQVSAAKARSRRAAATQQLQADAAARRRFHAQVYGNAPA